MKSAIEEPKATPLRVPARKSRIERYFRTVIFQVASDHSRPAMQGTTECQR